jgi:hypothetical protein
MYPLFKHCVGLRRGGAEDKAEAELYEFIGITK